jgi:hypothetical protein
LPAGGLGGEGLAILMLFGTLTWSRAPDTCLSREARRSSPGTWQSKSSEVPLSSSNTGPREHASCPLPGG